MDRKTLRVLAFVAIAVLFRVSGAGAQPFGAIDTPGDGQTVAGIVRVAGFVLDMHAVSNIDVLVDGVVINAAELNLPRVDVLEVFPTYYGSPTARPGFITSFLASNFTDGPHTVSVRVTESDSLTQTIIGSVTVLVDNTLNQAPFGYIDIPGPTGTDGANGAFPVVGWAIDDVEVTRIDFLIDGQIVAGSVGSGAPSTAIYGSQRPDVQAAFPDVPNSLDTGFSAQIDTTKLINGIHNLSVRAYDDQGASRELGTRTIQIVNTGADLAPFGNVDFPLDKSSLICSVFADPDNGFPSGCTVANCGLVNGLDNIVKGWALDVGSRLDQGGVAYVELLLDGAILANTRTNCLQFGQALINCYGINRPDVARVYSGYPNADNAGFEFSFSLVTNASGSPGVIGIYRPSGNTTSTSGNSTLVGFTNVGAHTLAIRAGDVEETVTQFGAMSVEVLCDQTSNDQPALGYIDQPTDMEYVNGSTFGIYGWAYDFQGIAAVQVDVDGQVVGNAGYGFFRPDVPQNDPRVPSSSVGWAFVLDTTTLSNSQHDLVIYVFDSRGNKSEIGRRKFVVDNNHN